MLTENAIIDNVLIVQTITVIFYSRSLHHYTAIGLTSQENILINLTLNRAYVFLPKLKPESSLNILSRKKTLIFSHTTPILSKYRQMAGSLPTIIFV